MIDCVQRVICDCLCQKGYVTACVQRVIIMSKLRVSVQRVTQLIVSVFKHSNWY